VQADGRQLKKTGRSLLKIPAPAILSAMAIFNNGSSFAT
jgi:hypothetical protein